MKSDLNKKSKNSSKSKINKNLEIIISSSDNKPQDNINILEKKDKNKKMSILIDNKIPETTKNSQLSLFNSKKRKLNKGGIFISNEDFEDSNKDISSDSETKEKKINYKNISKKRKGKRRKIKYKKKEIDEDYDEENELYILHNNQKNKNNSLNNLDDETDNHIDDRELKDFLNKKACQKKTLLKYKDIYKKKKNNKIIFLKEEDEEKYFEKEKNQNTIENENINNDNIITNINNNKNEESETKHFKKLKKNIDNKEMKLPLDAECIICCGIIEELANPDECNHDFCKSCLFEWSQKSSKCPMCKKNYNNIFFYDNGNKRQISINDIRKKHKKDKGENDGKDENIEKICCICKKDIDQNKLKNNKAKWYCKYCQIDIKVIKESKKKVVHFSM